MKIKFTVGLFRTKWHIDVPHAKSLKRYFYTEYRYIHMVLLYADCWEGNKWREKTWRTWGSAKCMTTTVVRMFPFVSSQFMAKRSIRIHNQMSKFRFSPILYWRRQYPKIWLKERRNDCKLTESNLFTNSSFSLLESNSKKRNTKCYPLIH